MIRFLSVCALSFALLHGCARPQPMGEELWRAVQHEDALR